MQIHDIIFRKISIAFSTFSGINTETNKNAIAETIEIHIIKQIKLVILCNIFTLHSPFYVVFDFGFGSFFYIRSIPLI